MTAHNAVALAAASLAALSLVSRVTAHDGHKASEELEHHHAWAQQYQEHHHEHEAVEGKRPVVISWRDPLLATAGAYAAYTRAMAFQGRPRDLCALIY